MSTKRMNRVLTQVRKTLLSEAKIKLDPKKLAELEKLTDWNNHNEAVALGCEIVKMPAGVKAMKLLQQLHKLDGGMSPSLLDYRKEVYDTMMGVAHKSLSPEDYEAFQGAF